jgi:ribosomal protein S6
MSEDTRTYELAYMLVPTISESEVTEKVTDLKNAITVVEGSVASEGAPEFIDLAYQIEKNVKSKKMKWNQGYFGWIKFTAAPEKLEALKKAYDGNLDLMRYMLIKTDIENNVVFKKPKIEAKRGGEVSFDQAELETIAAEMDEKVAPEGEVVSAEEHEDVKEHHEKLPSVENDIITEA